MATRTVNAVQNVRWEDQDQTMIYMEVDFDELDEVYVPFTAKASDGEAHCEILYQRAIDGDFGPIGAFQPPANVTGDDAMEKLRRERNDLLAETDYIEMPTKWATLTEDQQAAWATYRNALRDLPSDYPNASKTWSTTEKDMVWQNVTWPTKP